MTSYANLQLGAIISNDPEEEKRQKEFKSLLNKLTLDNYGTIKDKIVAVGIASVTTLKGLIDQVICHEMLARQQSVEIILVEYPCEEMCRTCCACLLLLSHVHGSVYRRMSHLQFT